MSRAICDVPPMMTAVGGIPVASITLPPGPRRTSWRYKTDATRQVGAEQPLRIETLPHLLPACETRVHRREGLGSYASVLGQVDAPSCCRDHLIEAVEQPGKPGRSQGYVQGQRPTFCREREVARPLGAEAFEDSKKEAARTLLRRSRTAARSPQRQGHYELVLSEASWPVKKVPSSNAVERVEEACQGDQLSRPTQRCVPVPHLVERRDRPRGEERCRWRTGTRSDLPRSR